MLRERSEQLEEVKERLLAAEMQLREANFDKKQFNSQLEKVREEKNLIDRKSDDVISELERNLSMLKQETANRNNLALLECDKVLRTVSALHSSAFDAGAGQSINTPRLARQLLDRIAVDINSLKATIAGVRSSTRSAAAATAAAAAVHTLATPDPGYDQALLEMCRSLEEENKTLSDSVCALKAELAQAKKDASAHRLIPHYRLAIIRCVSNQ